MTKCVDVSSIKVLTYEGRNLTGVEIGEFIGVNKDVHILVNCNYFVAKGTQAEVNNNYLSLIGTVIRQYITYSSQNSKPLSNAQRLIAVITEQITTQMHKAISSYLASRDMQYVEIQFKQMQMSGESFDIVSHLKVNVRACASTTTTIVS